MPAVPDPSSPHPAGAPADAPADDGWTAARRRAAALAETGVDPLDPTAASTARTVLLRRFLLDAALIFLVVAVVASIGLMVFRAFAGGDPLAGREIWVTSVALFVLLAVVVVRSLLPARAGAYERAWSAFVADTWPGAPAGDELGSARLSFVRRAHAGETGAFPAVAPGRKA